MYQRMDGHPLHSVVIRQVSFHLQGRHVPIFAFLNKQGESIEYITGNLIRLPNLAYITTFHGHHFISQAIASHLDGRSTDRFLSLNFSPFSSFVVYRVFLLALYIC